MKGLLTANVRAHASRYVATSIAIALATAFILACMGIANGFNSALERSLANDTLGADVVVSSKNANSFNDTVMTQADQALREAKLTEHVRTVYFNFTELSHKSYKANTRVLENPVAPFKFLELTEGKPAEAANEIAIDQGTAKALHAKLGDTITFNGFDHQKEQPLELPLTVTGIYPSGTVALPTTLVSAATFERIIDPEQAPTYVLLAEVDVPTVEKILADKQLNKEVQVKSQADFVAGAVDQLTTGTGVMMAILITFPALAIITAIIVVSTTFNVLLTQRKRELALLRAIGSTSTQIRNLALKEALLVGAFSAFLGVIVGTGLATVLNYLTGMIPTWKEAFLAISPVSMLIAFTLGLLIAVVASFGPARRIAGVSPMVALHPEDVNAVGARRRVWRTIAGLIVFTLGTSLMLGALYTLEGETRFGIALLGGMVSFFGALFLVGVLMPALSSALGKFFGKRSLTTQLAAENTMRNPTRTGATGTALFLGVTLVVMIMVGAASVRYTVLSEIDSRRPIDAVAVSNSERGFPTGEAQRINDLEHVDKAVTARGFTGTVQGENQNTELNLIIENVDLTKYAHSLIPQPKDDEVLVPASLWHPELKTVTIAAGDTKLQLKPVLARTPGYVLSKHSFNKLAASVPNAPRYVFDPETEAPPQLGQVKGSVAERVAYVKVTDNLSSDDVATLFSKITNDQEDFEVSGGIAERIMYTTILNVLLAGVIGMLGVSVLVALVGVTNTLALSVVERRRENALLRALGMTRASIRRMLSLEALLIGASALILGIGMGIFYGWAGFKALPLEDIGTPSLQVPWLQVLGISAAVLLAALVASIAPGRRAAKAHPVEAMADAS